MGFPSNSNASRRITPLRPLTEPLGTDKLHNSGHERLRCKCNTSYASRPPRARPWLSTSRNDRVLSYALRYLLGRRSSFMGNTREQLLKLPERECSARWSTCCES